MRTITNQNGVERSGLAWQCRGRCTACGTRVAGQRRIANCPCGGRVSYR